MKLKFRAEPKDVMIFIIFAVFLLYLVAIAVLNLHSFTTEARFHGLNPLPAFAPNLILPTLTFYLIALIGLSMTVSSYFFEREKGFGWIKEKKQETGYTRWATEKEMKEQKDIEKVTLLDESYEHAGIPLILTKTEAYVDNDDTHSLIIGSTGSGKTQCVILPLLRILAKAGESMIVTDPKGEIYEKTGGLLKEKGYNIILLNFRDPLKGNSWSPFSLPYRYYKSGNKDKATELIEDLAANILSDEESKADPFWNNAAADYFSGLTLGLFEDAEEEEANLNSINYMDTAGNERFNAATYIQAYFRAKGELDPAYISASTTINAPNDTKQSIISSFRQKIKIFSSRESLSEMLSQSDFSFEDIGKQKTAVFMIIHDEKKTYHALATIFVKQAYEALVDLAHKSEGRRLPIRTNFLLDEFANMPKIKDVDAMVSAARSRGIRFDFIIQNFSQLNKVYGADMAETIKGNCTNIHFLGTTELKALEEFSKLCGDKKPKKNKDKPDDPIRPLVTVSDLQQLKKFQFVIKRLRCNPFKVKFAADFEIDWGAKYDKTEYPTREAHEVKVFDLKTFVKEKAKKDMMEKMNDISGENIHTPPMGLGGFGASGGGLPGMGGIPDMDEFIKNIDATIAKLEAEEKAEKERLAKVNETNNEAKEEKTLPSETLNKLEEINKNEHKFNEPEELIEEDIKPKMSPIHEEEIREKLENKTEEKQVINKPNVFATEEDVLESTLSKEQPKVDLFKELEKDKTEKKLEINTDNENKEKIEKENNNITNNLSSNENIKETFTKENTPSNIFEQISDINIPKETNNINKNEQVKEKEEIISSTTNNVEEQKQIIDKPKINVDVDSIIVDEHVTDDQFFDDFFGDDD